MNVGDKVKVGDYTGTITAISQMGDTQFVQVALDVPVSGWYPSSMVTPDDGGEHATDHVAKPHDNAAPIAAHKPTTPARR
jgi:hypothetical protein